MFIDFAESGNYAMKVISDLAPAFAAGFAVQRLIEIIDSIISLFKKINPDIKRAILAVMSFLIGFFLAYRLGIKILTTLGESILGTDFSSLLDYFVTGLIVSAGTDGFNSILKFLNYSKEMKKAEVKTEEEMVKTSRRLGQTPLFANFATVNALEFQRTGDLNADIEISLCNEIKVTWQELFDENKWKETPFGDYTVDLGDGKEVVLDATLIVAKAYARTIRREAQVRLQTQVTLETSPEDIFPEMRNAILFGSI